MGMSVVRGAATAAAACAWRVERDPAPRWRE